MPPDFSEEKPIFLQIAEELEDAVLSAAFGEEEQIPSTTEISVRYKINPATALKGINLLVENSIVYKKRGIGMFVCTGAKEKILQKRRTAFYSGYIVSLIAEAQKLGLDESGVISLIKRGFEHETGTSECH